MRAHQLFHTRSKSIQPKSCLVGVAIRCRCIAPARSDRYQHHTVPVRVTVNGLLIEGAEIDVISYVEGGRYVHVEFTGTIAVFALGIHAWNDGGDTNSRRLPIIGYKPPKRLRSPPHRTRGDAHPPPRSSFHSYRIFKTRGAARAGRPPERLISMGGRYG